MPSHQEIRIFTSVLLYQTHSKKHRTISETRFPEHKRRYNIVHKEERELLRIPAFRNMNSTYMLYAHIFSTFSTFSKFGAGQEMPKFVHVEP